MKCHAPKVHPAYLTILFAPSCDPSSAGLSLPLVVPRFWGTYDDQKLVDAKRARDESALEELLRRAGWFIRVCLFGCFTCVCVYLTFVILSVWRLRTLDRCMLGWDALLWNCPGRISMTCCNKLLLSCLVHCVGDWSIQKIAQCEQ